MARFPLASAGLRVHLLALVVLALVPACAVVLSRDLKERRQVAVAVQDNALRLARSAALDQQRSVDVAHQLLIALARLPEVRDGAACSTLFADLLRHYPRYANIGAAAPDGNVYCSAVTSGGPVTIADRTYFQRALLTQDFAVGEYQIGRIAGRATVNFGYPVLDGAGQPQAVIFAALDLSWLNQLVGEAQLPDGSSLLVVDRAGTILARSPAPEEWVGRSLPEVPVVAAILGQGEGVIETSGLDGVERFFAFTPLVLQGQPAAGDASVAVGIPVEVALAEANRRHAIDLGALGTVGLLALAAVWVGGELVILRPVQALVRATRRLAAGDLNARAERPYGVRELNQLAETFDDMAEALERREEQLAHRAFHDDLTGLANRALFHDRLERALLAARRANEPLALLMLDLDRFKEINDTLGHHGGDLVLKQAAVRLGNALRASDTVARLGGDEFAVLLPATDLRGAILVARKLLEAMEQPFRVEGKDLDVGVSIGVACWPEHGADSATLLRRADAAMYAAKDTDGGYEVAALEAERHGSDRVPFARDLRGAIERGELTLHYQPQINLASRRVEAVEALVRWEHPEHGLIPPDRFVPLAERTGLIKPLSRWVLDTALGQCRAWRDGGMEIPVAVNLSMRNVHDPQLVETIAGLLETRGVASSFLRVEITESTLMADPARAKETLAQLRAMGVQVDIDDFGTGYSSLAHLKRLPINVIKIDRSFVAEMAVDSNDFSIVRSVIDLGHNLGLRVIAEGVEDRETLDLLAELGCDAAQGYHLSRPLPAAELERWLTTATWGREVGQLSALGGRGSAPAAPSLVAQTEPPSKPSTNGADPVSHARPRSIGSRPRSATIPEQSIGAADDPRK